MRPFVYALAGLNLAWSLVSVWGILARPGSLAFWTQSLMASLLLTVFVAPALVYVHARTAASSERTPDPTSDAPSQASSPTPSRPRSSSRGRWVGLLGISGLLVIWLFGSLFALFFDPARIGMWTQSLMWSFVGTMLWVPVLVFAFNPLSSSTPAVPAEAASDEIEPFIPPSARPTPVSESRSEPTPSTDRSTTEPDDIPETPYEGPSRYRRPLRTQDPSGTPAPPKTNAPSETETHSGAGAFYYPTNPPPSPSSPTASTSRTDEVESEDDIKWPDDE